VARELGASEPAADPSGRHGTEDDAVNPNDLILPSPWVSRSVTAENRDGAPGGGGRATDGVSARESGDLGVGWKISPCISLAPGETTVIADIAGPGIIQHIWMTVDPRRWRSLVLRMSWDDGATPAVEVPLGDFFCSGWSEFAQVSSQMVAVNPHGGFNCYWPMPFHRRATITIENLASEPTNLYYQVDYALGDQKPDALYLHARWRRSAAVHDGVHEILPRVAGRGRYVGTYLAWQSNSPGWWGEGEVKMYLDDDGEFPTICGTGTEDYFGGAWDFSVPGTGYVPFTTPYLGFHQVIRPDGQYRSQQRFGMYRWHVADSVAFRSGIRVEVQALGQGPALGNGGSIRYRKLRDDIASTALFYLDRPDGQTDAVPQAFGIIDLEVD
jgi:hypothetical protein